MKKGLIVLLAVIAVVVIIIISAIGSYNGLVSKQEEIESQKSTISTQLQRRADLIPNFVNSIEGYTVYESKAYTDVTAARSVVSDAKTTTEQAAASDELNKAISVWVNAVTENYPNLKANTQFVALQDELAGTENRIATARKDYNEAVKVYNSAIRKFPKNIIAGMFGFEKYDYFENQEGTDTVPEVSFN